MVNISMDLIKTIEDDEEIQDLSEDSDIEVDVSTLYLPECVFCHFNFLFLFLVSTNKTEKSEKG